MPPRAAQHHGESAWHPPLWREAGIRNLREPRKEELMAADVEEYHSNDCGW